MQSASFDTYAHQYDAHFTFSPIGIAQREIVRQNLAHLLQKDKNLLELNCGTGYDAYELHKHVRSLLATDASPAMIAECKTKFGHESGQRLSFAVQRIQDAGGLLKGYDLVFSNFGGLNCLSPAEFKELGKNCTEQLKPGSDVFLVVMGKNVSGKNYIFSGNSTVPMLFGEKSRRRAYTHWPGPISYLVLFSRRDQGFFWHRI